MDIIFSSHALERIDKRRILKDEAISAIKFPDKIIKKHGKYFFQKNIGRGSIEVCCQKTEKIIKIITLYWL